MKSPASKSIVEPCPNEMRREALAFLLATPDCQSSTAAAEEALDRQDRGLVNLDGLFVACTDGTLLGAIWATVLPGRLGSLEAPRVKPAAPSETAMQLLAVAHEHLRSRGISVVQCVLPLGDPRRESLAAGHYERISELVLLACDAASFPSQPPESRLRFEPYRDEAELAKLVAATYEDTLDCPRLNGIREMSDVLATHRAAGEHDPRLWFVAYRDAEPVGCLLLADHPAGLLWELVYMGLVPAARGRAFGAELVQAAQWRCAAARRERLLLFVDANNVPARNCYGEHGFVEWQRRECWLMCDR